MTNACTPALFAGPADPLSGLGRDLLAAPIPGSGDAGVFLMLLDSLLGLQALPTVSSGLSSPLSGSQDDPTEPADETHRQEKKEEKSGSAPVPFWSANPVASAPLLEWTLESPATSFLTPALLENSGKASLTTPVAAAESTAAAACGDGTSGAQVLSQGPITERAAPFAIPPDQDLAFTLRLISDQAAEPAAAVLRIPVPAAGKTQPPAESAQPELDSAGVSSLPAPVAVPAAGKSQPPGEGAPPQRDSSGVSILPASVAAPALEKPPVAAPAAASCKPERAAGQPQERSVPEQKGVADVDAEPPAGPAPEPLSPSDSPGKDTSQGYAGQRGDDAPTGSSEQLPRQKARDTSEARRETSPETPAPKRDLPDSASGPAVGEARSRVAEPRSAAAAPTRPVQRLVAAENPAAVAKSLPAREIAVRLSDQLSKSVDVRVFEKGGKIEVAVRTSDQNLSNSLRAELGQLVGSLQKEGFHARAWVPLDPGQPQRLSESRMGEGDGLDPRAGRQPYQGGSGQEKHSRRDESQLAWSEELESNASQTEETT